ncbi:MAG: ornithine--oxo-acid transaminase [Coriobacteriia bacterium]|nr:ornithine--oxo-acid transaminase [Coriobacteriia bacterium]
MSATTSSDFGALEHEWGARNYHPLPVVVASGQGAWVTDVEGKRYLDFLSAYSALNFGHRHPGIVAAAHKQLDTLSLTSRATMNDQLGPFLRDLCALCDMDLALPMNTGAEAVETSLKTARKWGYDIKGVPDGQAKIVVCENNFHGRTTTIISFSGDPSARDGFGPFTPGFITVPFGDATALEALFVSDPTIVGFLVEPVQGEAGVIVPPTGYLRRVRELCTQHGVLMIADEIQSGFGRTGATFACDHEGVRPDIYCLGKALGGGIMPVSAVVSHAEVLGVLTPGTHGSTFGGNPLACAIGREVLRIMATGELQERSRALGKHMLARLRDAGLPAIEEARGIGLWAGVQLFAEAGPARGYCEQMVGRGVIVKDTHATTLRLAPPLVIEAADLDLALDTVLDVLSQAKMV